MKISSIMKDEAGFIVWMRLEKKAPGSYDPGAVLVEVRGIEPLSENIQHNSPTCVADDLKFAVAHAHRPA